MGEIWNNLRKHCHVISDVKIWKKKKSSNNNINREKDIIPNSKKKRKKKEKKRQLTRTKTVSEKYHSGPKV